MGVHRRQHASCRFVAVVAHGAPVAHGAQWQMERQCSTGSAHQVLAVVAPCAPVHQRGEPTGLVVSRERGKRDIIMLVVVP